jgi:hypothetical protein
VRTAALTKQQTLLRAFPTLYEDEIQARLLADCGVKVGKSTVGRNLRKRLGYTRQRLTRISKNKFTPHNAARYHLFTQVVMPVLPVASLVWLDECGLDVYEAQRAYGRCDTDARAALRHAPSAYPLARIERRRARLRCRSV